MKKTSLTILVIALLFIASLASFQDLVQASETADTKGNLSMCPKNLHIPALAHDEHSVVLVWNKPDIYDNIVDYQVYVNGKSHGLSSKNNSTFNPSYPYFNRFYKDDTAQFHHKITYLNYTVTKLKPKKQYTFTVRAVYSNGRFSPPSSEFVHTTIAKPRIFSITDFGAVGDSTTVNTTAIQSAIDACTPGSVVLVPEGVFKTGAIFLKSDMTLKLKEGAVILGSEEPSDYPLDKGYKLYSYSTNQRPPSLINALAENREAGTFKNIRIVGEGTINGNGWKPVKPTIGEIGKPIPTISAGEKSNVQRKGVLSKNQVENAVAEGADLLIAYGQRRSSLITLRGVENVYIEGVTTLNPAFHGIMFLQCKNAVLNGTIQTTNDGGNADGVEFGNSQNIYAFNNFFDTGDDCVNFAAGTGLEAEKQPPMRFGHIFNNYFRRGHGAVVMGSHTGAWIGDILAEDNVINGTDIGLRGKSTDFNGGGTHDIVFRDNAMKNILRQGFIFTLAYSDPNTDYDYSPARIGGQFQDITVKNITFEKSCGKDPCIEFQGDPKNESSIENIIFENVTMKDINPGLLSSMRNGWFTDVRFQGLLGTSNPWKLENSTDIYFKGKTPQPAP